MIALLVVAVTTGNGFTLTEVVLVLVQLPVVPITVYVVVVVGETAIELVVALVFQL